MTRSFTWYHNLWPWSLSLTYCKTLIIRVTLFSRGHQSRFIHETLFSRFVISSSIILIKEIIGEDFIVANLLENKVLANKMCFTVLLKNFNIDHNFKSKRGRLSYFTCALLVARSFTVYHYFCLWSKHVNSEVLPIFSEPGRMSGELLS